MSPIVRVALIASLALAACQPEDPLELESATSEIAATGGAAAAHPPRNCALAGNEGKSCDDGLYCTVDDTCHAGVCVGEERPCASAVGFCSLGTCDEAHDSCVAAPRGGSCVDRCDTVKLKRLYRRGWQHGFEAVSKAWDRRHGNCDRSDDFVNQVSTRLEDALAEQDDEASIKLQRRCRKAGVMDGSFAALDVVQSFCDQTCFLDGDFTGKLSAEAYCEMALGADGPLDLAGWIRGPLNTCGLSYEVACDSSFIGESLSYTNAAGASCETMTVGAYESSWDESRLESCDYRNRDAGP
jgi:hypothetical protein